MKKEEWNEGLDHIDPEIVEEFIEEKDRCAKRKAKKVVSCV